MTQTRVTIDCNTCGAQHASEAYDPQMAFNLAFSDWRACAAMAAIENMARTVAPDKKFKAAMITELERMK